MRDADCGKKEVTQPDKKRNTYFTDYPDFIERVFAEGDREAHGLAEVRMQVSWKPNNRMESDEIWRADALHLASHA